VRAAIYLRISQDREGEGLGVTRQLEDCERLIAQRGWTYELTFTENDVSASGRKPRPQFQAMLKAVQDRRVDVIVAWALDRLTRNPRDRLALVEACQGHNVMVALVQGTDMDPGSPSGRLLIGLLGEVAQHEIEMKSERQIRAQRQAAEQGRRMGGRRPFGYDVHGAVINSDEADAIRNGYLWVRQGVPLTEIGRRWNAAGLVTGQGSPWRNDSVRRVLQNPRNAGRRRHKGELMDAPAKWPAIVDEPVWRDVVDILGRPERRTSGGGARQLLTGVAFCGVCGKTVHGGGASHGKPTYRCRSMKHVVRLAEPVDDYVTLVVMSALGEAAAFEYIIDRDKPDLDALRVEAEDLHRQLRELAEEFTDDPDVTPGQLRVMTRRVRAKLDAVESSMTHSGRLDLIGPFLNLSEEERAAKFHDAGIHVQRSLIDAMFTVELFPVGRGTRIFRPETVRMTQR
jgi:DNA invertase Pin-like site-specific DNA recombinase/Fe-S-cluster formation regulator IscX/YfhJ